VADFLMKDENRKHCYIIIRINSKHIHGCKGNSAITCRKCAYWVAGYPMDEYKHAK
jgi:hypothetical protein